MILICRNLKKYDVPIYHILNIDGIESQEQAECRLLKLFNLDQLRLFDLENDTLEQAYDMQSENIVFTGDKYQENRGDDLNG